jgi:hypothetical protein
MPLVHKTDVIEASIAQFRELLDKGGRQQPLDWGSTEDLPAHVPRGFGFDVK